ncbi:MAG TPA: sigma-54 dependent transcriptional regulator [Methylomirabilota bacterium]|nr:sigma-54 dependent transcriptional regulator [Methylomirabilota bacterium]
MNVVLIVDDEKSLRRLLKEALTEETLEVYTAADGKEALQLVDELRPDLVLLDLILPDMNGIQVLKKIKKKQPEVLIIIMTAFGEIRSAVEAMKNQAYDYLTKPFDIEDLKLTIARALEQINVRREYRRLRQLQEGHYRVDQIVGESEATRQLRAKVKQIAESEARTVLILGESGTGKELVAKGLHYESPRRDGPLIEVNCAAITETLFESELFGHEKGAFTDAKMLKKGLIELAHKGTVFLDEISEMSLATQAKFLRFIQDRTFKRVGGVKEIEVDVRIVAASNKDLEVQVKEGLFRQDLFYRLNVIPLRLLPLRERTADILPLAYHFLEQANMFFHKSIKNISIDAEKLLDAYHWPGNVRELKNMMERMVILENSETILLEHLPPEVTAARTPKEPSLFSSLTIPRPLEQVERSYILQVLEMVNGNKTKAAEILGISRQTLRAKLAED